MGRLQWELRVDIVKKTNNTRNNINNNNMVTNIIL